MRYARTFKFTTLMMSTMQTIPNGRGSSCSRWRWTQLHEASVTLIWRDSDERMAQFIARLNELGLQFMRVRASGTYWMPLPEDQAANWIIATYQQLSGRRPTTRLGRWAKRCAFTGGNGLRGDCERAKP